MCVFQGEKWKLNYVGKIVEFFETAEEECYFTVQWFFRAADTVSFSLLKCDLCRRF